MNRSKLNQGHQNDEELEVRMSEVVLEEWDDAAWREGKGSTYWQLPDGRGWMTKLFRELCPGTGLEAMA